MQSTKDLVLIELMRDPSSATLFLSVLIANITLVVRAQLSENINPVELKERLRICNELMNRSASELRNMIFEIESRRSFEQLAEVLAELIDASAIREELFWAIKYSGEQVSNLAPHKNSTE
jgi:hypothetical protein